MGITGVSGSSIRANLLNDVILGRLEGVPILMESGSGQSDISLSIRVGKLKMIVAY